MRTRTPHENWAGTDQYRATGQPGASLYVSILSAIDGARFVVVAPSEEACLAQVGAYVSECVSTQLWPAHAGRVQQLLAAGDVAGAVAEYVRHSGERWDREWLVTACLHPELHGTAWSAAIPCTAGGSTPTGRAFRRTDANDVSLTQRPE